MILINHGGEEYIVNPGERVAQLVIGAYAAVEWNWHEELEESARAAGGFGSTGS